MQIAIIGAGNVGRALATAATHAGHAVAISAKDPAHVQQVAADTGARAADSNRAAVSGADAVILAVPFDAIEGIAGELGDALDGAVVVDVSNRFAPEQLGAPSNAELVQGKAPGASVVKAFNTVFAARQADPGSGDAQLDGSVAGDDEQAKRRVLDFVGSLGFRPIDAGPLAAARALEGMGTLNIALNMTNGWPWQSGWKLVGTTSPAA